MYQQLHSNCWSEWIFLWNLLSVICYLLKMKNFNQNSLCDVCGVKKMEFKNAKMFNQHFDQYVEFLLWTWSYPVIFASRHFQQNWSWENISGSHISLNRSVTSVRKSFPIKRISIAISPSFILRICYPTTAISVNSNSIICTTL